MWCLDDLLVEALYSLPVYLGWMVSNVACRLVYAAWLGISDNRRLMVVLTRYWPVRLGVDRPVCRCGDRLVWHTDGGIVDRTGLVRIGRLMVARAVLWIHAWLTVTVIVLIVVIVAIMARRTLGRPKNAG